MIGWSYVVDLRVSTVGNSITKKATAQGHGRYRET